MMKVDLRGQIRDRITDIVATFDRHDAGIDDQGRYICHCGWQGPEAAWYIHLADALCDMLTERVVELPLEVSA